MLTTWSRFHLHTAIDFIQNKRSVISTTKVNTPPTPAGHPQQLDLGGGELGPASIDFRVPLYFKCSVANCEGLQLTENSDCVLSEDLWTHHFVYNCYNGPFCFIKEDIGYLADVDLGSYFPHPLIFLPNLNKFRSYSWLGVWRTMWCQGSNLGLPSARQVLIHWHS